MGGKPELELIGPGGIAPDESEWERVVRRHSAHYAGVCTRVGRFLYGDPEGEGRGQVLALRVLELELANLLEALDTAANRGEEQWLLAFGETLRMQLSIASEYKLLEEIGGRLLAVASQTKSPKLELQGLTATAQAAQPLCQYDAAAASGLAAGKLARQLRRPELAAVGFGLAGLATRARGRTDESRGLLVEALEAARQSGNPFFLSSQLNQLGILEFELGNYAASTDLMNEALEFHQGEADLLGGIQTLLNLGMVVLQQGRLEEAETLLRRGFALAEATEDRLSTGVCLANLGVAAAYRNDLQGSYRLNQQALGIMREIGHRSSEARLLLDLGIAAGLQQEFDEAGRHLQVALDLARELGNRLIQVQALGDIAIVGLLRCDYTSAQPAVTEALRLSLDSSFQREMTICAGLAGVVLAGHGENSVSALLLQASLRLADELHLGMEDYVQALIRSALLQAAERDSLFTAGVPPAQEFSAATCRELAQSALQALDMLALPGSLA